MFTLLGTLKRQRVTASVVGCISPSMAMSVALLELLTVHSTSKQQQITVTDTLKATVIT